MEDIQAIATRLNSFLERYRGVQDVWTHPDGLGIIQDCLAIFGATMTINIEDNT